MIDYTYAAALSYLVIVAAVLVITLAARRFVKGDFKEILSWLLYGFWFMALPYTLFIARELQYPSEDETVSWLIYGCMVIVGLCLLRAALLLDKFSKVYGFADVKEKK